MKVTVDKGYQDIGDIGGENDRGSDASEECKLSVKYGAKNQLFVSLFD